MAQVLSLISNVITQCAGWFLQILNAVGGLAVWSTACLVWLTYRFLLRPLFGEASSDLAKNSYNAFKRRKEK